MKKIVHNLEIDPKEGIILLDENLCGNILFYEIMIKLKPASIGGLKKMAKIVTGKTMWTAILRSVKQRRFRDPDDLEKKLPNHERKQISVQQRLAMEKMIAYIRNWLRTLEKKYGLK